jgi:tetratricopeptide (TPR) repeat protein
LRRGDAYSDKGDYKLAVTDYTQAVQLEPNYVSAYFKRGVIYAGWGELERALTDFDSAIQLFASDELPHYADALLEAYGIWYTPPRHHRRVEEALATN